MLAATGPEGWFGVAAHGSEVDYRLVLLLTVVEGKISRDERIYDRAGLLERFQIARRDEHIRLAEAVQNALLPRTAMSAPFCNSVGRAVPCRAIGGDFFDFLDLPSGDRGIVIGDVAGKGSTAGVLAALIQGMLSVEAMTGGGRRMCCRGSIRASQRGTFVPALPNSSTASSPRTANLLTAMPDTMHLQL